MLGRSVLEALVLIIFSVPKPRALSSLRTWLKELWNNLSLIGAIGLFVALGC